MAEVFCCRQLPADARDIKARGSVPGGGRRQQLTAPQALRNHSPGLTGFGLLPFGSADGRSHGGQPWIRCSLWSEKLHPSQWELPPVARIGPDGPDLACPAM